MAWAIFHREVHMSGSQRMPKTKVGFRALPSPVPQQFPRDFVDYAVSIGAAKRVPSPRREAASASKRSNRA